jgi:hypothetical protein
MIGEVTYLMKMIQTEKAGTPEYRGLEIRLNKVISTFHTLPHA